MANVKTAISLQKTLFDQVELLARELKVSRSRLFAMALEDYIQRRQNMELLEKINRACQGTPPDPAERKRLRAMRRHHRRIVDGEW